MKQYLILIALMILVPLLNCAQNTNQQASRGPGQSADKETIVVQGDSMLPGIRNGDKLSIERFDHDRRFEVKRGDVVLFWYPNNPSQVYMQRLIGLPGETVEFREGAVFINEKRLEEPYIDPKRNLNGSSMPPMLVKDHYYFVLGDNRDNASDSRAWGLVPERYIFARMLPK